MNTTVSLSPVCTPPLGAVVHATGLEGRAVVYSVVDPADGFARCFIEALGIRVPLDRNHVAAFAQLVSDVGGGAVSGPALQRFLAMFPKADAVGPSTTTPEAA
jgi:hypothetical protein